MSGAITALSTFGTFAQPALQASGLMPAFIRNTRKIGTIIPDVTIDEHHSDRLQVTQHPVANNTPISDHAYLLPKTLTMRCGWTNANPVGAAVEGFMAGGLVGLGSGLLGSLTEQRVTEIYQSLRDLQATREPISVTTGKRTYQNMLITELSVTTDRHTEYSLILECQMQEVLIVTTSTTQQPPQSSQTMPQKTADTTDQGTQQPNPNAPSILQPYGGLGGFFNHFLNPFAP